MSVVNVRVMLGTALMVSACLLLGAQSGLASAPNSALGLTPHALMERPATGTLSQATSINPMSYHGGPVLQSVRVHLVLWGWQGQDPAGEGPVLTAFLKGVGGSPYLNLVTQYCQGIATGAKSCNGGGQPAGNPFNILQDSWSDDANLVPAAPKDADIMAESVRAAQHFGVDPKNHPNDLVFIALPDHTPFPHKGACGYHGSILSGASYGDLAYLAITYALSQGQACGENFLNSGNAGVNDGVSIIAGHELAEAITDPINSTGWQSGQEIGDPCIWLTSGKAASRNITLPTGTFAVQTLWSNAVNGCDITWGQAPSPSPSPSPSPASPPGAASGATAQALGNGQATVSWTPPVSNGGSPVTAYALYAYTPTPGGSHLVLTTNPTSMSFSGLIPGYYTFTVTAWNGVGWGPWCAWAPWDLIT